MQSGATNKRQLYQERQQDQSRGREEDLRQTPRVKQSNSPAKGRNVSQSPIKVQQPSLRPVESEEVTSSLRCSNCIWSRQTEDKLIQAFRQISNGFENLFINEQKLSQGQAVISTDDFTIREKGLEKNIIGQKILEMQLNMQNVYKVIQGLSQSIQTLKSNTMVEPDTQKQELDLDQLLKQCRNQIEVMRKDKIQVNHDEAIEINLKWSQRNNLLQQMSDQYDGVRNTEEFVNSYMKRRLNE